MRAGTALRVAFPLLARGSEMDEMARKTEVLTGVGDVYAGDQLLRRTRYRVEVASDEGPGGPPRPAAIEGSIDITGISEAVVLAGARELTLHLEDGRRLPVMLVSTSGRIRGVAAV
jgi:hypothetical protein